MLDRQQVGLDRQCKLKIIPSGLSENEKIFGMDRLIVFFGVSTQLQNTMMMNSTEFELESPLWQYVTIHLHKGEYQGIKEAGADRRYHIYVPYMFEEEQLPKFLHSCIKQLQLIQSTKRPAKLIQQVPLDIVCYNANNRRDF